MGDEVAWAPVLAAHRRQGAGIGLLHLTPGEKGHPSLDPQEYASQKREEARACAEALGASMWSLDYRDGELPVSDAVKWEIADVLREAQPRAVITHWRGSMHKDHTAAHDNLADAIFYAALPAFARDLPHHWVGKTFYGENWEDLRGYVPEVFFEVLPEDWDVSEGALRNYALFRGEVSPFPYLDYYRALARARGCEVGLGLACTFSVPPESHRRRATSLV